MTASARSVFHDDIRIIYHDDDLDGRGSAAIALRHAARERGIPPFSGQFAEFADDVLVPATYNRPLPDLPEDCAVILLDFSYPADGMRRLVLDHKVTYIDHHAPKIAELRDAGVLDLVDRCRLNAEGGTPSAIELAWMEFHPGTSVPAAVNLLSRHDASPDVDRQGVEWDCEVVPFQHGLRGFRTEPAETGWDELLAPGARASRFRRNVQREGAVVLNHLRREAAANGPKLCYRTELRDRRVLACNGGSGDYFKHHPDYARADILLSWRFDPQAETRRWKCTVWPGPDASWLDVGEWARENFGGGGHKGCAGFHLDSPPMPVKP